MIDKRTRSKKMAAGRQAEEKKAPYSGPLAAGTSAARPVLRARSDVEHDLIQAWVGKVDELAVSMERAWGIDRLPRLVDPKMAAAFYSQARKLNEAIQNGSVADVEYEANRMMNAWRALNQAAEALEAPKLGNPLDWTLEALLPSGGVLRVVATHEQARLTEPKDVNGRDVTVLSMDEVVNLFVGFPELVKIKQHFPGAEVVQVRVKGAPSDLNDPIPGHWGD